MHGYRWYGCWLGAVLGFATSVESLAGEVGTGLGIAPGEVRTLSLEECIQRALERNRAIQIQRYYPRMAQLDLAAARGAYDPQFFAAVDHSRISDTGGYDPQDLSKDALYDAKAEEASVGFTGRLPSGMQYLIEGDYSATYGERNYLNFDSYNVGAEFTLQQPLLKNAWIDAPRLLISVSRHNVRITELGVRYVVMDVVTQVERAYAEWWFARADLRAKTKLLGSFEGMAEEARRKVAAGTLSVLDAKLAESQAARAAAELVAVRHAVERAVNELKTLLGDDFVSSLGSDWVPGDALVAAPTPLQLQESWQHGLAQRPDLAQLRLDSEKVELTAKYHRNQLFPALDVVGGYGRRGSSRAQAVPPRSAEALAADAFDELVDGVAPHYRVGMVFTLPLTRARERADYRRSRELQEQVRVMVKQREELVLREIDDAYRQAHSSYDRVQATRLAVQAATAAVEAEKLKLAAGRSTYYFVLQLEDDVAEAESDEARAMADYHQALAAFRFAEASTLEHHRIQLEVR